MSDYWCSTCETSRRPYRVDDGVCSECDSDVDEEWPVWPRAKRKAGTAIGAGIVIAVVCGPPAWALYTLFTADVLYASETVTVTKTVTEHSGALPEVAPVVGPWLVLVMLVWMATYAPVPRRF